MTSSFIDFRTTLEKGAQKINVALSQNQVDLLTRHAQELLMWNKKINLTAITDPIAAAEKHFVDALAIQPFLNQEKKIIDLGTGGGFPAIPLKVLNPAIAFCLVDASQKKINFLKHVIRMLKLENIEAVHGRVEDLHHDPTHGGQYDAVISRGFASLEKFVNFALPFLNSAGTIYAMKGRQGKQEITNHLKQQFDLRIDEYRLPFEKSHRTLIRITR